jgi:CheY-like chemotaxis protein/anti-sigma regulatory factor (Ser/Thr protein kinase)
MAPRAAAKRIEIVLSVDDEVPYLLEGDETRIKQIVNNLVSNAVKFTEEGEVFVSAEIERKSTDGRLSVAISVTDSGIGIPPEKMDRLFKSFSQADSSTTRRFGGTGLGLAICKRLSDMMGGVITAESEGVPGKGSLFRFVVPLKEAASCPPEYLAGEQPRLRGKRILIVDDNATNARILAYQAESWGMYCEIALDAGRALEILNGGTDFEAAILDMHMPGMDGSELAERIRALPARRTLPLILLSSIGDVPRNTALFFRGLTKPAKAEEIHDALIAALGGSGESARRSARRRRRSAAERAAEALEPARRLRILVAEDVPVNQRVAVHLLARIGQRADLVSNGAEALEVLSRSRYDLLLLDTQMPVTDGFEVARRLRGREDRPRIVAVTASALAGDRERCLEAGMDDYISKPIRLHDLARVVRESVSPSPDAAFPPVETFAAAQSCEDGSAVFDAREFLDMYERMEEDGPVIVSMFLETTPEKLDRIASALSRGDAPELRSLAHALRSTAAVVGARGLSAACADLERIAAEDQGFANAEAILAAARAAFSAAGECIEGAMRSNPR